MSSNTLEIIQGLAQAAANVSDIGYDEKYSLDGEVRKTGLRREEGSPIIDSRVNDGFKIKFSGDLICIHYQSDVKLKEIYSGNFEQEMDRMLNEIKKFLQREYKAVTGNSITLTAPKDSEVKVLVQSTSRVRSFVQAHKWFKISKTDAEPILSPSEDRTDKAIRDFLALSSKKRPNNDKRK